MLTALAIAVLLAALVTVPSFLFWCNAQGYQGPSYLHVLRGWCLILGVVAALGCAVGSIFWACGHLFGAKP